MTTVVNLRREAYDVYIGRAGHGKSGYFGNPLKVSEHGAAALTLYREFFLGRVNTDAEFRARVLALRGKRLGCFCKPAECHGDIIAEWVDAQPECHREPRRSSGHRVRLTTVIRMAPKRTP